MKRKILPTLWWLSLVALGGAMDAEPVSWAAVAGAFAAFGAISAAILGEQREGEARSQRKPAKNAETWKPR